MLEKKRAPAALRRLSGGPLRGAHLAYGSWCAPRMPIFRPAAAVLPTKTVAEIALFASHFFVDVHVMPTRGPWSVGPKLLRNHHAYQQVILVYDICFVLSCLS